MVLSGIIASLWAQIKAMKRATIVMLRKDIVSIYARAMDNQYTTIYENDAMTDLYAQYKKLGGNGSIDMLMTSYKQLEIKITFVKKD